MAKRRRARKVKRAKVRRRASKSRSMGRCKCKCHGRGSCVFWGFVLVTIGVLFLLQDLNKITLWGISWFSVVFMLLGLMKITKGLY